MDRPFWHKQTKAAPLFPDLLWSRPENRSQAGKILIIGGSGYEFKAPANAYGDALDAGIGSAKVLLPISMKKTVQDIFPEAEFAPTTPSGSFARTALAPALELAEWADGILLAGDLGHNSETAVFIESLLQKYNGPVTLAGDSVQYCLANPAGCLERPNTLLVITMAQLQKLGTAAKFTPAFTSDMDLLRLVDGLHDFTQVHQVRLVIKHLDTMFVASGGQVSTTKLAEALETWCTRTAAHAATWTIQTPDKPFDAITTSVIDFG